MEKLSKENEMNDIVEHCRKEEFVSALKVSDRIQLESLRLLNCSCEQSRFVKQREHTFVIEKSAESVFEKDTNHILVFPKFKLETFELNASGKESFATIEATFFLVYQIVKQSEEITQESINYFGNINGVFNTWPYWREYVQSTTVRMGLPPLTIPVYRVVVSKDEESPKDVVPEEQTAQNKGT